MTCPWKQYFVLEIKLYFIVSLRISLELLTHVLFCITIHSNSELECIVMQSSTTLALSLFQVAEGIQTVNQWT